MRKSLLIVVFLTVSSICLSQSDTTNQGFTFKDPSGKTITKESFEKNVPLNRIFFDVFTAVFHGDFSIRYERNLNKKYGLEIAAGPTYFTKPPQGMNPIPSSISEINSSIGYAAGTTVKYYFQGTYFNGLTRPYLASTFRHRTFFMSYLVDQSLEQNSTTLRFNDLSFLIGSIFSKYCDFYTGLGLKHNNIKFNNTNQFVSPIFYFGCKIGIGF